MKTSRFDPIKYLKTDEDIAAYLEIAAQEAQELQDERILLRAKQNAAKANSMNAPKICPVCGEWALEHDIRDMTHSYKGHSTIIENVEANYCAACGESITTGEAESRRVMAAMIAFNQAVNAKEPDKT